MSYLDDIIDGKYNPKPVSETVQVHPVEVMPQASSGRTYLDDIIDGKYDQKPASVESVSSEQPSAGRSYLDDIVDGKYNQPTQQTAFVDDTADYRKTAESLGDVNPGLKDSWIDLPVAAGVALAAPFLPGAAAAGGALATAGVIGRNLLTAIPAEYLAGQIADTIEEEYIPKLPESVRTPATIGLGLATGLGAEPLVRGAARGVKSLIGGTPEAAGRASDVIKSQFEREVLGRVHEPVAPASVTPVAPEAPTGGAGGVTLHANPIGAAYDLVKGAGQAVADQYQKRIGDPLYNKLVKDRPENTVVTGYKKLMQPGYRGDLDATDVYNAERKAVQHKQRYAETYAYDIGHRLQDNLSKAEQDLLGKYIRGEIEPRALPEGMISDFGNKLKRLTPTGAQQVVKAASDTTGKRTALLPGDLQNLANGMAKNLDNLQREKLLRWVEAEADKSDKGKLLDWATGGTPDSVRDKLIDTAPGAVQRLPDHLREVGDEAVNVMLELGDKMRRLDLLKDETFYKDAGQYMKRLYTTKEYQYLSDKVFGKQSSTITPVKKKGDIDVETREKMGEILLPGYPIAKGIIEMSGNIAKAERFQKIAANPKWAVPADIREVRNPLTGKATFQNVSQAPDGWKKLEGDEYGALKDAYVHPEIHRDLSFAMGQPNAFAKHMKSANRVWSFWKAVASPSTAASNSVNNLMTMHVAGADVLTSPILKDAIVARRAKNAVWEDAYRQGLFNDTFAKEDLNKLFDNTLAEMGGIKAGGNAIGAVEKAARVLEILAQGYRKTTSWISKKYQVPEEISKLAMFIDGKNKGMDSAQAAAYAQKWLLDYSDVTNFQKGYKDYVSAFATWSMLTAPRMVEAAIRTPWRFALPAALYQGIQYAMSDEKSNQGDNRGLQKKALPKFLSEDAAIPGGRFLPDYIQTSPMDDKGQVRYTNVGKFNPLTSLKQHPLYSIPKTIYDAITENEPSRVGSLIQNPYIQIPASQIANKEFFTNEKLVSDAEARTGGNIKNRLKSLYRGVAPTALIQGKRVVDSLRGDVDDRLRTRGAGSAALELLGIKSHTYPPLDIVQGKIEQAKHDINEFKGENSGLNRKLLRTPGAAGKETIQDKIDDKNKRIAMRQEAIKEYLQLRKQLKEAYGR